MDKPSDEQLEQPRLTAQRTWLPAPHFPDENEIENLSESFRAIPRIVEAWVVGSRMRPRDGTLACPGADIALVLDPPLPDADDEGRRPDTIGFLKDIDDGMPKTEHRRGWLLVTASLIRAHEPEAVKIYSRPTPIE